jgi:hypothetical protein
MTRIDFPCNGNNQVRGNLSNSLINSLKLDFRVILNVPLKFSERNLIKVLKFAILFTFLLNGVIREVN